MNKAEYLKNESVQEFIGWISPRLDEPSSLVHFYHHKKSKSDWNCDSIYSAFRNYSWNSIGFEETKQELEALSANLKRAIKEDDNDAANKYCKSILKWGGVTRGNNKKIDDYGIELTSYLRKVTGLLHPDKADTRTLDEDIVMNSGFTKIYSLIIDDFVIYDSRVGAALGMLVVNFCQEKGLQVIPAALGFAYGNARGDGYGKENRRNPGYQTFNFPVLGASAKTHTVHNLRANWLLKEILTRSASTLSNLREFEAALFMIGYDVQSSRQTTV